MMALTERDLRDLESSGIPADLANTAFRRVESKEGAELIGRNGSRNYAGLAIPYHWPGDPRPREWRLRRDEPELEQQSDGSLKQKDKYLSPPGRGNLLYFAPSTSPTWLTDVSIPAVITEGEKKTLALSVLSWHALSETSDRPRFLSVGLSGVWNWRGTIGKAAGQNGERSDVKGKRPEVTIDDLKGTGGKAQNADCVILMERTTDRKQIRFQSFSKDFDNPVRILLNVAPRGSKEPKFTYAGDLDALGQASSKKAEAAKRSILDAMKPGEWLTKSEIAAAAKVEPKKAQRYLSMMAGKELDVTGETANRRYCRPVQNSGHNQEDR